MRPHPPGVREELGHAFRPGIGGQVEVRRLDPEEPIPDAAAREVGLVPAGDELVRHGTGRVARRQSGPAHGASSPARSCRGRSPGPGAG